MPYLPKITVEVPFICYDRFHFVRVYLFMIISSLKPVYQNKNSDVVDQTIHNYSLNPFPGDKILDWSILKQIETTFQSAFTMKNKCYIG